MIRVTGVDKNFGMLKVLRDVSYLVEPGKVTGLVGPNGCGKTTMIKIILGLAIPNRGEIEVAGTSIRNSWEYRKNLGYMPQNPDYPSHLTVNEMLDLLEDIRGARAAERLSLIEKFNLESVCHRPFGQLSGGTKQKIAIVSAFMFAPQLLILDEPTVGLDPESAIKFKDLVRGVVSRGQSVLLVTHIMGEMEQLADNMIFLLDGRVRFSGSVAELIARSGGGGLGLESAVANMVSSSRQRTEPQK